MLEAWVKQLEKQAAVKEEAKAAAKEATEKEVAEKEVAGTEVAEKKVVEMEAAEKEATEKEVAEKENDDEEEEQSWPSGSSDDGGPVRLHRVNRWFQCPICFNHLYQHKNSLFLHIQYMMIDEFSPPDVVEQHRQLNRLIEVAKYDS
jgi:flagellar biosynthesis GTPase FlhF